MVNFEIGDTVQIVPEHAYGIISRCDHDNGQHECARWDFRLGDTGTVTAIERRILVTPHPPAGYGEIPFWRSQLRKVQ